MASAHPQTLRTILHIDMDAFFASVEQLDNLELRGKPVLVGAASRRGVVAAASYEARKFGVHSAMPMVKALQRCPHAVVIGPRHRRYHELSEHIFAIFRRYTPDVESLSLDEAFLDVTGSTQLFGDGQTIAMHIKERVQTEVGLIASAGVAPCKFVAKIASDLGKPNGLLLVASHQVQSFLNPLPIERMWGVGKMSAKRFHALGINTIGSLATAAPCFVERHFGKSALELMHLARGHDPRPVVGTKPAKSMGAEHTFEEDVFDRNVLERTLLEESLEVARRLSASETAGRTITLKVKYSDFHIKTVRKTLAETIWDGDSIFRTAQLLLRDIDLSQRPLRLIGVTVSNLSRDAQRPLFTDADQKRGESLQQLTNAITTRFGTNKLTRARLLPSEETDKPKSSPDPERSL